MGIPFHRPYFTREEIEGVVNTLKSGWITSGPKVQEFENNFKNYIGCKYAVAVNSCTAALHLALKAIGLEEGDEVILPTMTFTSTAEVVTYFKAKPVLVDIERDTYNIDISKIREKISPRTKAVIPVHYGGQSCDMEPILALAKDYDLKVIEDAAHAIPSKYKGKMVGTIGDITCFSFYSTKPITTGEGGFVTTDNRTWAERMKMMSLHGISKDAWKRYSRAGSWYYEVVEAGHKYNMTDIAASLGITQLKRSNSMWIKREYLAEKYNQGFKDLEEINIPRVVNYSQHAWHLYVIQLNLGLLRIDRNCFIEKLRRKNIGSSVHFIPLHLHPYYQRSFGYKRGDFPNAEYVYDRIISLPLYPKMTKNDIQDVVGAVKKIISLNRI